MQEPGNPMREAARQGLSAGMDGHATAAEMEAVCAAWRSDADARETWHAYHLIGDVLRSNELASSTAADEDSLRRLRQRMADEPVALHAHAPWVWQHARWPWTTAAAVAGVVAVAGVMVMLRPVGVQPSASDLNAWTQNNVHDHAVVKGQLIRDAELERYFAAHRRVSSGATVVMPGAAVRSIEAVAIEAK